MIQIFKNEFSQRLCVGNYITGRLIRTRQQWIQYEFNHIKNLNNLPFLRRFYIIKSEKHSFRNTFVINHKSLHKIRYFTINLRGLKIIQFEIIKCIQKNLKNYFVCIKREKCFNSNRNINTRTRANICAHEYKTCFVSV